MSDLYWHCLRCGDHEAVEPTTPPYVIGDLEPCECGGTVHVMTSRMGAAFEQGLALGMGERDAWARAKRLEVSDER